MSSEATTLLEELASRIGATNVFVLVPVDDGMLFNVDGVGRGAGWAGNVTLQAADEPVLARAVAERLVTFDGSHPRRVFGPYWARKAAAVAFPAIVVVFGGDHLEVASAEILATAVSIRGAAMDSVRPTKLEADQAEIDQARRTVAEAVDLDMSARAVHLAASAATALGCEYAAVYLREESPTPFIADRGWRPVASSEEVTAAILPLWQAARQGPVVEQDVSQSARVHRPLGWDDGVVSAAAVPLGSEGAAGVLVVVHTGIRPRGFTVLCTRVLEAIGEAGTELLAT